MLGDLLALLDGGRREALTSVIGMKDGFGISDATVRHQRCHRVQPMTQTHLRLTGIDPDGV